MSTKVTKNKKSEAVSTGTSIDNTSDGVRINLKNWSTIANLAIKLKLSKPKRSKLLNAKANSKIDFLALKAKKTFICLQKALTKALIFWYFDLDIHIWINTDLFGYVICEVRS